jgi:hypothetical protein
LLPPALTRRIFSLLPVDVRARAALVCRAWRVALAERALWVRLDLSNGSGVRRLVTDTFLRAAVRMAHGELQSLSLAGYTEVTFHSLRPLLLANAGTLRELELRGWAEDVYRPGSGTQALVLELLLHAAPQITLLGLDNVRFDRASSLESARAALRREAPFGPLRASRFVFDGVLSTAADVAAFAADLPEHAPSLTELWLNGAPLASEAAVSALVDGVLAARLTSLKFDCCALPAVAAPHLARLLLPGAPSPLTELHVEEFRRFHAEENEEEEDALAALLQDGGAARLALALRDNATLTALSFTSMGLWMADNAAEEKGAASAGVALLGALTGHVSVRTLNLSRNSAPAAAAAAVGTALGALVASNAPSLTQLDVSYCNLRDDGLRPLLEALARNTHLRMLRCHNNGAGGAFMLHTALPAARACTSLHSLEDDVFGTLLFTRDADGAVLREARA